MTPVDRKTEAAHAEHALKVLGWDDVLRRDMHRAVDEFALSARDKLLGRMDATVPAEADAAMSAAIEHVLSIFEKHIRMARPIDDFVGAARDAMLKTRQ